MAFQRRSCAFVEESKPAWKQVGAGGSFGATIVRLVWLAAHECDSLLVYHVKRTNQERQNSREFLEQLDQIDHQSFSCLTSDLFLDHSSIRSFVWHCVNRIFHCSG